MSVPARASDILGGTEVLQGAAESPEAMIDLLRTGLPIAALDLTVQVLGLTAAETSHVLGIPPRTLARRRNGQCLKPHESDRLFRVARLVAHALEIFDDPEQTCAWFHTAIPALAGQFPVTMLDTEAGTALVDDELGRIEFGLFA